MAEPEDSFEIRVSRLANYLTRAHKYNKSSILFALYLSEFLRSDAEKRLRYRLNKHEIDVVDVDAGTNKDLPSFFSSMNSNNVVFFVRSIKKRFPESLFWCHPDGVWWRTGTGLHHRPGHYRHVNTGSGFNFNLYIHHFRQRHDHENTVLQTGL